MATALEARHQSLADFLAWERLQPGRYERLDGVVRMMTGGTIDHNRIIRNVSEALARGLQGGECEVFTSDVKVMSPTGDVMYPDVVVACGPIPGKATEIEAPTIVVEVLSPSTAERDQGRKRWAYWSIPSLRHYVLIDQDQPIVEIASPDPEGSWRSVIHRGLDARLRLDALGVEIGLKEVFPRVAFALASPVNEAEAPVQSE
ncbi:MAG TPA: Uma2 family endonuclease [Geminicoccaceae bacterium]|nr:Uma2 family endonuclease [Geminicoccaceae bacterium]